MKFKVIDNKTGKEANPYEIALYEEWAQRLVYCDMEGFAITENGDLMLADECGNSVYCDPERFKVVFEEERPHGEWLACTKEGLPLTDLQCRCEPKKWYGYKCSRCLFIYKGNALTESLYCQNCGADMRKERG